MLRLSRGIRLMLRSAIRLRSPSMLVGRSPSMVVGRRPSRLVPRSRKVRRSVVTVKLPPNYPLVETPHGELLGIVISNAKSCGLLLGETRNVSRANPSSAPLSHGFQRMIRTVRATMALSAPGLRSQLRSSMLFSKILPWNSR